MRNDEIHKLALLLSKGLDRVSTVEDGEEIKSVEIRDWAAYLLENGVVIPPVHCENCKCRELLITENKYFCNKYGGYVTENDYCSRFGKDDYDL